MGPTVKWVGLFINSTKEFGKIHNIPHSGIKLQILCSDRKTNNTIEFVASNYPKITISMPQFDSGTPNPLRNLVLVSVPAPCN
jgi:hypothetical protein